MSAVGTNPGTVHRQRPGFFVSADRLVQREAGFLMANEQRNILDEIAARLRGLMNDMERLLQPQPQKPARVPVPVRPNPERRPRPNDPYRR
jgi:uncharacterized membrane protein YccC